MWWASLRRWFGRVEIRLAATLVVLAAPVLAAALFLSLADAAHEMLEERGEQVEALAHVVAAVLRESPEHRLEGPLFDLMEQEQIAIRVLEGDRTLVVRGHQGWFSAEARNYSAVLDAVRAAPHDVILLDGSAGSRRFELAASLEDFIKERGQLTVGFWISLVIGLFGAAAFAVVATHRSLRPLHRATRAIGAVNANQLQTRLPLRHTGDAMDRHAEALNLALDRLETGFGRIRAFSADVAHELRTPINRLLNQSGSRLLGDPDADDLAQTLLGVQHTVEEMQEIVEGLLLLAQADEGRLRTQMREVALAPLLDGLQELYRPACEERDVDLEVKSEDLEIVGDEGLLVRCIGNLIDNALGHSSGGGRVAIDALQSEGGVAVRVCDTGAGVPAADLERIFDRFVRLDSGRSRRGSGLGLPIARAIAVAHGGTLAAAPASGGGTCFELWLPRAVVRS